jgi:hypothetical protein
MILWDTILCRLMTKLCGVTSRKGTFISHTLIASRHTYEHTVPDMPTVSGACAYKISFWRTYALKYSNPMAFPVTLSYWGPSLAWICFISITSWLPPSDSGLNPCLSITKHLIQFYTTLPNMCYERNRHSQDRHNSNIHKRSQEVQIVFQWNTVMFGRITSSAMRCNIVGWAVLNILKEHSAFFFRVKQSPEDGDTMILWNTVNYSCNITQPHITEDAPLWQAKSQSYSVSEYWTFCTSTCGVCIVNSRQAKDGQACSFQRRNPQNMSII